MGGPGTAQVASPSTNLGLSGISWWSADPAGLEVAIFDEVILRDFAIVEHADPTEISCLTMGSQLHPHPNHPKIHANGPSQILIIEFNVLFHMNQPPGP